MANGSRLPTPGMKDGFSKQVYKVTSDSQRQNCTLQYSQFKLLNYSKAILRLSVFFFFLLLKLLILILGYTRLFRLIAQSPFTFGLKQLWFNFFFVLM